MKKIGLITNDFSKVDDKFAGSESYLDLAGNIYIVLKEHKINIVHYDDKCYNNYIVSDTAFEKLTETYEYLGEL